MPILWGMVILRAKIGNGGVGARGGFALLVVLFVVMAITILSLGFLARSNTELVAGSNFVMRSKLDNLVASGFEQAKTLIVNGYDVAGTAGRPQYFNGATGQNLSSDASELFDVSVLPCDGNENVNWRCGYEVTVRAYKIRNGEKVGVCDANGVLRFDPALACWVGAAMAVPSSMRIYGDVYCAGNFTMTANTRVTGDVWAAGTVDLKPSIGQRYAGATAPVGEPNLYAADLVPDYYYYDFGSKSVAYCAGVEEVDHNDPVFGAAAPSNKQGVYYAAGDTIIKSNTVIAGTLVVDGNLTIQDAAVAITAKRNFPALVVSGQIKINSNTLLSVTGVTQAGTKILVDPNATNVTAEFYGMTAVKYGTIQAPATASVVVRFYAWPVVSQILYWPTGGNDPAFIYTPAPSAHYKNIKRVSI